MSPTLDILSKVTATVSTKVSTNMRVPPFAASVVGVVQDFWQDGPEDPVQKIREKYFGAKPANILAARQRRKVAAATDASADGGALSVVDQGWSAPPGGIAEKFWGTGCVLPAEIDMTERLVKPLGLDEKVSVLDLTPGLGFRMRNLIDAYGVAITGLEIDPDLALRGMGQMIRAGKAGRSSIMNFNPLNFKLSRGFDAVIMRELLYRIETKDRFLANLKSCTNQNAFISFTDYVVENDKTSSPAFQAWQAVEKGVFPLGMIEVGEVWAKAGFMIINQEDMTTFYKKEIMRGVRVLAINLASIGKIDKPTKQELKRELDLWVHRLAAFENGLRFVRFLASRKS